MNETSITITSLASGNPSITFIPQELKSTFESLSSEDSGRTDDGVMHIGSWLQRKLVKLEIVLPPYKLSDATYSNVLSFVQGQDFNVTYFDVISKATKTIHMYCSNSSADWYSGVLSNGIVEGASFNCIAFEDQYGVTPVAPSVQANKTVNITNNGTYQIFPDDGYGSLGKVTANVNVSGTGPTPTGTLTVDEPGTYDVTEYAYCEVNIPTYEGGLR